MPREAIPPAQITTLVNTKGEPIYPRTSLDAIHEFEGEFPAEKIMLKPIDTLPSAINAQQGFNDLGEKVNGTFSEIVSIPEAIDIHEIAFGNNTFVIVSTSGIFYSEDNGINWIKATTITETPVSTICYNEIDNKFVALSAKVALISIDGKTWIESNPIDNIYGFVSITFGAGRYVAIGLGFMLVSVDGGMSWTKHVSEVSQKGWYSIAFGNNVFAMIPSVESNIIATSPDGINWTETIISESNNTLLCVRYLNNEFIAVGNKINTREMVLFKSTDGGTWIEETINSNVTFWLSSIAYGDNTYIISHDEGFLTLNENDDSPWQFKSNNSAKNLLNICFGNGAFIAIRDYEVNGSQLIRMTDVDLTLKDSVETLHKEIKESSKHTQRQQIKSVNGQLPDKDKNIVVTAKDIAQDELNRFVTDEEKLIWDSYEQSKADKSTTLDGYGIVDGVTKTELQQGLETKQPTGDYATKTELNTKATKSTTLSGYGIADAATKTELIAKQDKITDILTLGKMKISWNATDSSLDFEVVE